MAQNRLRRQAHKWCRFNHIRPEGHSSPGRPLLAVQVQLQLKHHDVATLLELARNWHNLNDLIDSYSVALLNRLAFIYLNLNRARTEGIEVNGATQLI